MLKSWNPVNAPRNFLNDLTQYLLAGDNPRHERGCFITAEFTILPFDNIAENPEIRVRPSDQALGEAYEMMLDDRLYGWAHSHTSGPAIPSLTDVFNHKMPIRMIIYSVSDDIFRKFTVEQLNKLKKTYLKNNEIEITMENKKIWMPI